MKKNLLQKTWKILIIIINKFRQFLRDIQKWIYLLILVIGFLMGIYFSKLPSIIVQDSFFNIGLPAILFVLGFFVKNLVERFQKNREERLQGYISAIEGIFDAGDNGLNNKKALDKRGDLKIAKSIIRLVITGSDEIAKNSINAVVKSNNGEKIMDKLESTKSLISLIFSMRKEYVTETKLKEEDLTF